MSVPANPFDRGPAEAAAYDAWYGTPAGRAALHAEVRCVRELLDRAERPWVDVGAGSGRFGGDLGADAGVDPALALLRLASRRMPSVVRGVAEALPLRDASVGAALSVAVFEFLAVPDVAMREVARVLRPGGRFVLGFMPRGGAWARAYARAGIDPASVFHGARFLTAKDARVSAAAAGLRESGARSALFEPPDATPSERMTRGVDARAGFVALALTKSARKGA